MISFFLFKSTFHKNYLQLKKKKDNMEFYSYTEIPLDEKDARYCRSFSVDESTSDTVQDFFEEYGFVVFRDVISTYECSQTIDSIWDHFEKITPTIKRDNRSTWDQGFSSFGLPKDNPSIVVIEPCLLRLRQHPSIVRTLQPWQMADESPDKSST